MVENGKRVTNLYSRQERHSSNYLRYMHIKQNNNDYEYFGDIRRTIFGPKKIMFGIYDTLEIHLRDV